MSMVGDLERLVGELWAFRVPIGIGLVLLVVGLIWLARRRGWHRAVRRHPRASALVLAVVLAIAIPVTWVLAAPLFIRTELVEAAPSAAAGATTAAVVEGEFQGADEFHFGSGRARLVESFPGEYQLRFDDFSVLNGPDLYVYLSPSADGYAEGALELGPLKATDGSFGYDLPAGTDISAFRSAVVWCRAFSVQFAHAPLSEAAS